MKNSYSKKKAKAKRLLCDICKVKLQRYALLGGAMSLCTGCYQSEIQREMTITAEEGNSNFIFSNPRAIRTFVRTS